jgi:3-dehydroquinate synthetase
MISKSDLELIETTLVNSNLPIQIPNIKGQEILQAITSDKKNRAGKIKWSLPIKIGKVISDIDVPLHVVVSIIKNLSK